MPLAATSWPDAVIAVAGTLLVAAVIVVVAWQALGAWKTSIAARHEGAGRDLTEQTLTRLQAIEERLSRLEAGIESARKGER